jgi:hypothetical protein
MNRSHLLCATIFAIRRYILNVLPPNFGSYAKTENNILIGTDRIGPFAANQDKIRRMSAIERMADVQSNRGVAKTAFSGIGIKGL